MEKLGQLVQSLAIIIIITTFLELLVPNSKMRRYIQLVLGLFIIVMILNPVLDFLDGSKNLDYFSWADSGGRVQLETILAQGKKISEENRKEAVEIYGKNLEKQMAALIGLIPGIEKAEVKVKLKSGDPFYSADSIEEVIVEAQATGEGKREVVSPVKPVEIKEKKSADDGEFENLKSRILTSLSDFFGIDRELIKVNIKNP
ncbi:MAG: stage III sporulation protein AF [Clostridia bacterium]|nr:stage III sporulation protein AF [Clostridia bacterium]